uniref:Uncharacterized protein n=1 Tax=viral metagenome TaxID=1070528 RepID=A0A6C0HBS6_9ZZZZ
MELSQLQMNDLMKRFPDFELSYETVSHKKVSNSYNICLAIPHGKKSYAWFTFFGEEDKCILLDINREKKISKGTVLDVEFSNHLEHGTLVYGTIVENESGEYNFFVIEDIVFYKGLHLKNVIFKEKMDYINELMTSITPIFKTKKSLVFTLPIMWDIYNNNDFECATSLPDTINQIIPYTTHHLQYRCFNIIKPYLNSVITRKLNFSDTVKEPAKKVSTHVFDTIPLRMDFFKPQYKYPTIFQVTADLQNDIYHLFAYGKNNRPVYYNVAYIPTYKTSVFMNSLFRKIKENINIDYIEESDDEEEFQNIDEDKYVDIDKVLLMECIFHTKFKKWVPMRVVANENKVVHISKLCNDINESPQYNHHNNQHRHQQNNYENKNQNNRNPGQYVRQQQGQSMPEKRQYVQQNNRNQRPCYTKSNF